MNDDLLRRLARLEALAAAQHEQLDALTKSLARVERATTIASAQVLATLAELRSHLVDLTLDGYYPTRLPPKPMAPAAR